MMLKKRYTKREITAMKMAVMYLSDPMIGYREVAKEFGVCKSFVGKLFHNDLKKAYPRLATVVFKKATVRQPTFVLLREYGSTQNEMPLWKADRSDAAIIAKARGIIDGYNITTTK